MIYDQLSANYVEPFVGSGAVFLFVQPSKAFLSDINSELIDLYKAIRSDPKGVWNAFKAIPEGKEAYITVRKLRPVTCSPRIGPLKMRVLQ